MSNKKYLRYSLLSASMFTLLAFAIINHFKVMTYIDNGLFNLLYDYHSPWLTGVMIGISNIGSPAITSLLLILLILIYRQSSKQALFLMTFYFGTSALALVLKLVIHRSRPLYQLLPDSGFSFPSGHSVCAVLLLLMVLFLFKENPTFLSLCIRCVTFVFTLLVILSRVYLRDHFPTDILASLSLDFSSYYLLLAFIG